MSWFELAAAASAPLAIHVLLALAAEPRLTEREVFDTYAAYFPWVSLVTVMLDSYGDRAEDAGGETHSYFEYYEDDAHALRRLREAIERATRGALRLRNGERHAVLVSCMVAMFLSKDSVRTPELRETTHELASAGGSLTRFLLPVLRLWRIRHGQQSA